MGSVHQCAGRSSRIIACRLCILRAGRSQDHPSQPFTCTYAVPLAWACFIISS